MKSMLASSFSRLSFLKAISSLVSLTKALMTAMPEKLSWEKSDSLEKASCRTSHLRSILPPTMVLTAISSAMGIRAKPVRTGSIRHILMMDSTPRNSASKNIRKPEP